MYESPASSVRNDSLRNWYRLIDAAPLFGADIVAGLPASINTTNIEAALIRNKRAVTALAEYARQRSVRLAFRNTGKADDWFSGGWNIRGGSSALDILMREIDLPNVGIDLKLVHELTDAVDPLRILERWNDRVFHVYWKDDVMYQNVLHRKLAWDFSEPTPEKRMSSAMEDKAWAVVDGLNRARYDGSLDVIQETLAA
jgi:sugar phosphate isomerase/epimerase